MTIEKYGNNRERFINDLMNLMVLIEGGIVELRDYINTNKECLTERNATQLQMKMRTQYITKKRTAFDYYRTLNGSMRAKREPRGIGMRESI